MLPLVLSLLLAQAAAPAVEVRALDAAFFDEAGVPVTDLTSEEVAVVENGTARATLSFRRDDRPLHLVVLVDSSQPLGSDFRQQFVNAVAAAIARLPEGTRYALWTTGDRPTKLVDFTDDRSLAAPALRRVFPQGGNRVLDAIVEAGEALRETAEGARAAMLIVSGVGIGFTDVARQRVVDEGLRHPVRYLVLQVSDLGTPEGGEVSRFDYEYVFSTLARRSGGRHETVLSSMAVSKALPALAAELAAGYRVVYDALPGAKKRKLELTIARPGVVARFGESVPAREP